MTKRLKGFVGACVSATFLAACAGSNGFSPSAPLSVGQSVLGRHGSHHVKNAAWTESVLHSFDGSGYSDGYSPFAGLINVGGTFYGTTENGGGYNNGTVFTVTAAGTEKVLHSFSRVNKDGALPYGNLVNLSGTLYGTTSNGGTSNFGTVFTITTAGKESVLYSFKGGTDGAIPLAGLINVNGTFYGTTEGAGGLGSCSGGCGTVFKLTTNGTETVLYRFSGAGDGGQPYAGLINVNGTLYGTTTLGGANRKGTVFTITTSGTLKVLHSFAGSSGDGANPYASLTDVNGALYGTTIGGGTSNYGTVFTITTAGAESVLYSFAGGSDGRAPQAELTNVNGMLYGTTVNGGGSGCSGKGCGTVFGITTYGSETVLHSFGGPGDGAFPYAGVTNVDGALYGTTEGGGAYTHNAGGTVFSITPPVTETVLHSFGGSGDGDSPYAPLLDVSGTLYGTTAYGGTSGGGIVYSITPYGTYAILHAFRGNPDGASPWGGLANIGGALYGTTQYGGTYNSGTAFSISLTPSGTESVLQSFYAGSDGAYPIAGPITSGGKLYGTTYSGGVYNAGTAFSMTTSGQETVLHSFGGSGDGRQPWAPLLDASGTLYGTTIPGGAHGCGTVFAVSESSGAETVLHSFSGQPDGCSPGFGTVTLLNGTIYGTTSGGGGGCGCGTVFSITPLGTESVIHKFAGGADGSLPYGGLALINGTLYGTTLSGGAYGQGTIFSITPTGTYTVLWSFGGQPDGGNPRADLIAVNGTLYGTTAFGGANNQGTVFSLSVPSLLRRHR